ncbi:holo-ACP synthase [Alkaliphilus pronyensis]|uniref:Holo-[acyl-carrier-protein] synthase n=1 Tax=Alkaliphilus pronyensis TaxID=1482732 RepID=A0A6I0EY27_9FIRM|nr:holo-ACP synthase [Alkaliphilus pronyensis]KAB3534181.1 holo-ACP synthase [Alkaliphilus pronyensis]
MIIGIGIDIVEIKRIENAMKKNPRFINRILTDNEIQALKESNMKPESVAGFFAAKEAVVKAIGTGFRDIQWQDIEIYKDSLGKPMVHFHNNASKLAYSKNIDNILISISHSRENAVAQAIALGFNNKQ